MSQQLATYGVTTKERARRSGRWYRPIAFGVTLLLATYAALVARAVYGAFASRDLVGIDYRLWAYLGNQWAATGSMYAPFQLAGPYPFDSGAGFTDLTAMPALYPPMAAPVFWLVGHLPAVLWWAVPIALILYACRHAAPWAWPLIPLAFTQPHAPSVFVVGGTVMWVAAGLALSFRYGWPALVVMFKPTLALFALVAIKRRSAWVAGLALAAVSLLFLPEWIRYVTVIDNMESPGLLYSLDDVPLILAVMVTAWSGHTFGNHNASDVDVRVRHARLLAVDDDPRTIQTFHP